MWHAYPASLPRPPDAVGPFTRALHVDAMIPGTPRPSWHPVYIKQLQQGVARFPRAPCLPYPNGYNAVHYSAGPCSCGDTARRPRAVYIGGYHALPGFAFSRRASRPPGQPGPPSVDTYPPACWWTTTPRENRRARRATTVRTSPTIGRPIFTSGRATAPTRGWGKWLILYMSPPSIRPLKCCPGDISLPTYVCIPNVPVRIPATVPVGRGRDGGLLHPAVRLQNGRHGPSTGELS